MERDPNDIINEWDAPMLVVTPRPIFSFLGFFPYASLFRHGSTVKHGLRAFSALEHQSTGSSLTIQKKNSVCARHQPCERIQQRQAPAVRRQQQRAESARRVSPFSACAPYGEQRLDPAPASAPPPTPYASSRAA